MMVIIMKLKDVLFEYIDNCGKPILDYFFVAYSINRNGKKDYIVKTVRYVAKEYPFLLNYEVDYISEGEGFFKVFYLKEK